MTEWYWLLAMMIFMHVIEDFHLQGILADLKQRDWWVEQEYKHIEKKKDYGDGIEWKYDKDYIVALLFHGFEWAFFVCIPLMYFVGFTPELFFGIIVQAVLHAMIDDLKCNRMKLNLWQDQALHMIQILALLAIAYGW